MSSRIGAWISVVLLTAVVGGQIFYKTYLSPRELTARWLRDENVTHRSRLVGQPLFRSLLGDDCFSEVTSIDLSNRLVSIALRQLPISLKQLSLKNCHLSDDRFDGVSLQNLRVLDVSFNDLSDESLTLFAVAKGLLAVDLTGTTVGDNVASQLSRCDRLRICRLGGTRVSDRGLQSLSRLASLRVLDLNRTDVTDHGFCELQVGALAALQSLDLSGTQISDESVASLAQLPALQQLVAIDTQLTPQGIHTLRQRRPDIQIITPSVVGT